VNKGDIVAVFCCDSCCYRYRVRPKVPADSRGKSLLCAVCGHYNIGSMRECIVGDWLSLKPLMQGGK